MKYLFVSMRGQGGLIAIKIEGLFGYVNYDISFEADGHDSNMNLLLDRKSSHGSMRLGTGSPLPDP